MRLLVAVGTCSCSGANAPQLRLQVTPARQPVVNDNFTTTSRQLQVPWRDAPAPVDLGRPYSGKRAGRGDSGQLSALPTLAAARSTHEAGECGPVEMSSYLPLEATMMLLDIRCKCGRLVPYLFTCEDGSRLCAECVRKRRLGDRKPPAPTLPYKARRGRKHG